MNWKLTVLFVKVRKPLKPFINLIRNSRRQIGKGITMKKLMLGLVVLLMTVLAACGGSSGGEAEEIYQKAIEAGKKLESAEMELTMHQIVDVGEEFGTMTTEMDSVASFVIEPFAMHQKGNMSMEMEDFPMDMEMEIYATDSEFYMYDSMSNMWMKMDAEMVPNEMAVDYDFHEQLNILESFIDEIEFKEESDHYVFKYDGDGKKLIDLSQEIIKENMDDTLAGLGMEASEVFDQMDVHSLYYEILIDKKTYDTKGIIMNLDFEIDIGGETLAIQQEVNATYTGINTIDKIEVPQEIVDEAQEL